MNIEKEIQQTKDDIFSLLEDMAAIKEQIARAKAAAFSKKIYSDVDWFHAAQRALRHKQIEHQKLQGRLSDLKRKAKSGVIDEALLQLLDNALNRMDNARNILTDGNPRPECNWGMLDTSDLRAKLLSMTARE